MGDLASFKKSAMDAPETGRPDPGDKAFALAVENHARGRLWFVSADRRKGAAAAATLRRRLAKAGVPDPAAEMARRWAWYAAAVAAGRTTFQIRNAREFADHWDRVVGWADRDPAAVAVSPAAAELAADAAYDGWPDDTVAALPAVAQRSIDAVVAFTGRLRAAPVPPILAGVRDAALEELDDPAWYVGRWLRQTAKAVTRRRGWSGRLAPWRPDDRLAARDGRRWAADYTGDPGDWDKLLKWVG